MTDCRIFSHLSGLVVGTWEGFGSTPTDVTRHRRPPVSSRKWENQTNPPSPSVRRHGRWPSAHFSSLRSIFLNSSSRRTLFSWREKRVSGAGPITQLIFCPPDRRPRLASAPRRRKKKRWHCICALAPSLPPVLLNSHARRVRK